MALAEFIDGFWRAILTRAEAHAVRLELPADYVTRMETALTTFYGNNTNRIENADGVPGVDVPIAYQAGIELGTLVVRQRARATVSDWGTVLAGRMETVASNLPRPRIRRVAGELTVEEIGGG